MKVLIVLNSAWNLLNFRASLIKALLENGHEVVLAAPADENVPALQSLGARFIHLPMSAHGINPLEDLILIFRLICLFKNQKPTVILTYTTKPNIYGGLVGRLMSVPVVNNIAGLGSAFIKGGWIVSVLSALYRLALARSTRVFFQNPDDRLQFVEMGLVAKESAHLLPGSGVNLQHFKVVSMPCLQLTGQPICEHRFIFLLVARLLKDKGIEEYAKAARQLKPHYPEVEFAILGVRDQKNPNAVSDELLLSWQADGIVNYWGNSNDVRNELALADCVVLPSYREGTPRALLEAAAMGRPLIATDVPGCREVVQAGLNGLLCEPKNANSLAKQMEVILQMQPEQLRKMANASREWVQERFDEKIVIEAYLKVLNNLVKN